MDVGTNVFSLEIKMQIKGADKNTIGRNGKDVLKIIHAPLMEVASKRVGYELLEPVTGQLLLL